MPIIDDISRLRHILEAAQKAVRYTKNRKRGELDADELLGLGLIRLLEIMLFLVIFMTVTRTQKLLIWMKKE